MYLDLQNEIQELINAKANIKKKLTESFIGKWSLISIPDETSFRWSDKKKFQKTKDGKVIAFQITACRPKSQKYDDESSCFPLELVLEGADVTGKTRTNTITRVGYNKSLRTCATDNIDKSVFEFDAILFETEEEAILYATLSENITR